MSDADAPAAPAAAAAVDQTVKAEETAQETNPEVKTEAKEEQTEEAKPEVKAEETEEAKPDVKTEVKDEDEDKKDILKTKGRIDYADLKANRKFDPSVRDVTDDPIAIRKQVRHSPRLHLPSN